MIKNIIIFLTIVVLLSGCSVQKYESYKGLVMAGYQGWFNAEGDGADRGFYHYKGKDGFKPGSASVDMWPDVTEYEKTYPTAFLMPDGSPAHVFSSEDSTTVDTHFRWMKEYGLDGVFMQRFVSEIKQTGSKRHFDKVLRYAMASANRYNRAIAVMYDLSGMEKTDTTVILGDLSELSERFSLHDKKVNKSYLHHNGKPLVAVWGIGFNDKRKYGIKEAECIVRGLKDKGFSILLGVPTNWRTLDGDTDPDPRLHALIRECDVIMPWFVGRYDEIAYDSYKTLIKSDIDWCNMNGIDYAPLVYPGFAWRNMQGDDSFFVPRNNGSFFKKQLDGALDLGAKMLYIAMFDEIDEGTAIFKCSKIVPIPQEGTEFVPIDKGLQPDHYLKLAGETAKLLKKSR